MLESVRMVRVRGSIMDKHVWKDAVKSVRKEKNWKRPTKKDLQEAARRYISKDSARDQLSRLIGDTLRGKNV